MCFPLKTEICYPNPRYSVEWWYSPRLEEDAEGMEGVQGPRLACAMFWLRALLENAVGHCGYQCAVV